MLPRINFEGAHGVIRRPWVPSFQNDDPGGSGETTPPWINSPEAGLASCNTDEVRMQNEKSHVGETTWFTNEPGAEYVRVLRFSDGTIKLLLEDDYLCP